MQCLDTSCGEHVPSLLRERPDIKLPPSRSQIWSAAEDTLRTVLNGLGVSGNRCTAAARTFDHTVSANLHRPKLDYGNGLATAKKWVNNLPDSLTLTTVDKRSHYWWVLCKRHCLHLALVNFFGSPDAVTLTYLATTDVTLKPACNVRLATIANGHYAVSPGLTVKAIGYSLPKRDFRRVRALVDTRSSPARGKELLCARALEALMRQETHAHPNRLVNVIRVSDLRDELTSLAPCDTNRTRRVATGDIGRAFDMLRHRDAPGQSATDCCSIHKAVLDLLQHGWMSHKKYIHVTTDKVWFTDSASKHTLTKSAIVEIVLKCLDQAAVSIYGVTMRQLLGVPQGGVMGPVLCKVLFRYEERLRLCTVPSGMRRRYIDDVFGVADLPNSATVDQTGVACPATHVKCNKPCNTPATHFNQYLNPYRKPLELKDANVYICDPGVEVRLQYLDTTILVSRTGIRTRYITYGDPQYHKYKRAKPANTVRWMYKGAKNTAMGKLRRVSDACMTAADCICDAGDALHMLYSAGYSRTTLRSALYSVVLERWGLPPRVAQEIRKVIRNCHVKAHTPAKSCLKGEVQRDVHPPLLQPCGPLVKKPTKPVARRVRFVE